MELTPYTRHTLKQYRKVINARRQKDGLPPLTTAKIIDSMCDFMTCQSALYLCSQYIIQPGNPGI